MTLAWTAVSWARGSSTRWGSWGWSWHQRDQAAGASPPPLLGFRPPHGPRPHPGRRRAQERQQQARGGRKVHGEGRGALGPPARGGGHGRGGGGGLYRKCSPFSDTTNLYFRKLYVVLFRNRSSRLLLRHGCLRKGHIPPATLGRKNGKLLEMDFFFSRHIYLGSWQILNFRKKI